MSEAEQLRARELVAVRRMMGLPASSFGIWTWPSPAPAPAPQRDRKASAFVLAAVAVKARLARGELVQIADFDGARRVLARRRRPAARAAHALPVAKPASKAELMLLPVTVLGFTEAFRVLIVRRPIGDLFWSGAEQWNGQRARDMWLGAREALRRRFPHPDRDDWIDTDFLWGRLCEVAVTRPALGAEDLRALGLKLTHRDRGGWAIRKVGAPRTAFAAGRIR